MPRGTKPAAAEKTYSREELQTAIIQYVEAHDSYLNTANNKTNGRKANELAAGLPGAKAALWAIYKNLTGG